MKYLQITDDFYWIGVENPDLRRFDIIMETEFGTTYNSYLLKTSQGVVLFETVKDKFFDEYIEKVKELVKVEDIKYIICNHTEPDHSGSLEKFLELNPNIEILSTIAAQNNLKEIVNKPFNGRVVKDQEEVVVGNKTLRFIMAPNLHWPDTMYTYIVDEEILVTCDSFGAHYATNEVLLSQVANRDNYEKAFAYYTEMIMGPFKPFVAKAMDKIRDLPIRYIATGHGCLIDQEIDDFIQRYTDFAKVKTNDVKKVVIAYVTAYGYTHEMAEIIKDELENQHLEVKLYDLVEADQEEVYEAIKQADGVLYGSCTIVGDALPPVWHMMNRILTPYDGIKVASAFGSYGWSGEAVPNMMVRLKQQKMKLVDEGLRIKFKPSDAQKEEIHAYAKNFAQALVD
ncbi:flavorubredoxin [Breznakia blatticola]|uniref:Flavorubredoxin n=1 Tax=Breznakia blatticola TaxID=1754012 RepID=A0A4R7ZEV5_9FIRM|nr:FprA family A-type flavoprotein [Breznakia blatticola]TDW14781.1 flavorubredoxin [Breznakia blatticola]